MNTHSLKVRVIEMAQESVMWFIYRPLWLWRLITNPTKYCNHECYYPEHERKSRLHIFMDQIRYIIRYGVPNMFYFPYGLDVKSTQECEQYIHYYQFAKWRNRLNDTDDNYSVTAVLRDKFLFGMFTSYLGVNSAENIAIISPDGFFIPSIKQTVSAKEFVETHKNTDLFIKPIDGECGKGIVHLVIKEGVLVANGKQISLTQLMKNLGSARYLVQSTIVQHRQMAGLHKESLNTIRLVTIKNPHTGKPEVFPSILRVGTGDSIVDNTSQGGLAVGIDLDSGRLKESGFYKPEFGTKVYVHPDSNIRFADFIIPHFQECKKQAIFLHSMLPQLHSIGWDIAIDENGPVFVEGNDNWEINGPQICNGGLKTLFLSYCK